AQDLPDGAIEAIREWMRETDKEITGVDRLLRGQPIWVNRLKGVGWIVVEVAEMRESLRIIGQVLERIEQTPGRVMVDDPKIAWPAQLSIGSDGMGNSAAHVNKIMNGSMESLIHHFKLVTEGFRVPTGQAYVPVESPRGE